MAEAYLLERTGEGDRVGRGGIDLTELFHVEVDSQGDDPRLVLQDGIDADRDPWSRTGVPINQPYPDPTYNFLPIVWDYITLRSDAGKYYEILVLYRVPDIPLVGLNTAFTRWRYHTSMLRTQRKLTVDLDGKTIGTRKLKPVESSDQNRIGSFLYGQLEGESLVTKTGYVGYDGDSVKIIPYAIDEYHLMIHLDGETTKRLGTSAINAVEYFTGRSNIRKWFQWGPETVLIYDAQIYEGASPSQSVQFDSRLESQIVYGMRVDLAINRDGWQNIEYPIVYENEGGAYPVVDATGKQLKESFRVKESPVDFNAFFAQLGGIGGRR